MNQHVKSPWFLLPFPFLLVKSPFQTGGAAHCIWYLINHNQVCMYVYIYIHITVDIPYVISVYPIYYVGFLPSAAVSGSPPSVVQQLVGAGAFPKVFRAHPDKLT